MEKGEEDVEMDEESFSEKDSNEDMASFEDEEQSDVQLKNEEDDVNMGEDSLSNSNEDSESDSENSEEDDEWKLWACNICNETFEEENSLKRHRKKTGHWKTLKTSRGTSRLSTSRKKIDDKTVSQQLKSSRRKKCTADKKKMIVKKDEKMLKKNRRGSRLRCPFCNHACRDWDKIHIHCHGKHNRVAEQAFNLETTRMEEAPPRRERSLWKEWKLSPAVKNEIIFSALRCPVCQTERKSYASLHKHYVRDKKHGTACDLASIDPFMLLASETDVERLQKINKNQENPTKTLSKVQQYDKPMRCPLCDIVMCNYDSLRCHYYRSHGGSAKSLEQFDLDSLSTGEERKDLDIRMSKRWKLPLSLNNQIEACRMRCPSCNSFFVNYNSLRNHYWRMKHGPESDLAKTDPFSLLANEEDVKRLRKMRDQLISSEKSDDGNSVNAPLPSISGPCRLCIKTKIMTLEEFKKHADEKHPEDAEWAVLDFEINNE